MEFDKYPQTVKAMRREIWRSIVNGAGSGASFAIMEKGEIVCSEGIGVADRETLRPVDKATRFDIASVSKIFTTAAMMKLADLGLVDIDKPICGYIRDFEMADPRYEDITARMLFNHSSGLPGSCYNQAFCSEPHPDYSRFVLDVLKRAHLKHDPGAKSTYCNDGFTLCEIIIERVTGRKYIEFLAEHIFSPLGLCDTGESVGVLNIDNVAELYDGATGKKSRREVSPGVGMGGISSTAEDLCRFGQSFCANGKSFLSPESLTEMLKPQPSLFSGKLRARQEDCHMGWDVNGMEKYEKKGLHILMKGGLTWYSTKFIVLPQLDVSMALSFSGPGPSQKPSLAILDVFLEEKGYGSFRTPAKKARKFQPVPAEINDFAGFYTNGGQIYRIAVSSAETLEIKSVTTDDPAVNYSYSEGYFFKKGDSVPYYFNGSGGMKFFVAENEHSADLVYQKIEYLNTPKRLDWDINGKVWLNANIDYDQSNWNGMFIVKSVLCAQVPGYIDFGGIKKIESGCRADIAGTYFRDQKEMLLKEEDGVLTAYISDYIMKPEETADTLAVGITSVVIQGSVAGTVWLKTGDDLILTVDPEQGVIVHVIAPDRKTFIYCSRHQEGDFFAAKGSYIACFGKSGGRVTISAE